MSQIYKLLIVDSSVRSLRISYFENEMRVKRGISEDSFDLSLSFDEQIHQRRASFIKLIDELKIDVADLSAIVARFSHIGKIQPGAYKINDAMIEAVSDKEGVHPSAFSIILANDIMQETGVPGYIYNSLYLTSLDEEEFYSHPEDVRARAQMYVSGAWAHAMQFAEKHGQSLEELNIIVSCAGFAPTTVAFKNGKIAFMQIDRIRMASFSKMPLRKMPLYGQQREMSLAEKLETIQKKGLINSYIGTFEMDRINDLVASEDETVTMCISAAAKQSSLGVSYACNVLDNRVDAVISFGPMTNIPYFNKIFRKLVGNTAPIYVENATLADFGMAYGILRVLREEEFDAEYLGFEFYKNKVGGMDKKIALVTPPGKEELFDYYKDYLSGFDVLSIPYDSNDSEKFIRLMNGVSGFITFSSMSFKPGVIKRLSTVKVISLSGTDVNENLGREAAENGIMVCNIKGYSTEEVAEHVCAMILALSRNLIAYSREVNRNHKWNPTKTAGKVARLSSQQLGIIGLGKTGFAVAKRMMAFGMHVVACDPYIDPREPELYNVKMVSLDELLQTSDVISCNFPAGPYNHNLINADAFSRMARCPLFINCSSGYVVDEEALADALDNGLIRGAGIDVFETDPPDFSSFYGRFLDRDNVIITPHAAFYSDDSEMIARKLTASNLRYALNGEFDKVRFIAAPE